MLAGMLQCDGFRWPSDSLVLQVKMLFSIQLVLLLQHSVRMEEAVTAVMMAVQTIIRLDGGSRGGGDDGCPDN